jgi:hypothetical protein
MHMLEKTMRISSKLDPK